MRRLRIARSATEMESLGPLWRELERAEPATIFQSYAWNLAAGRHFSDRAQPLVVALESDAGAVIVPSVQVADGQAAFLGEALFDYRDVLVAGDHAVVPEALAILGGRELTAPAVRAESILATGGWGTVTPWVGAPLLRACDITPEAFWAQHFKARKQMRRLRRIGGEFRLRRSSEAGLAEWVYQRKAEQFASSNNDIFSDATRRRCMQAIVAASGELCEIFTIEVGSDIIGTLITFRDRGARRLYTIWHDPAWNEYSPGIVLLFHACYSSLRAGLDVDFLTGEQPHKARFATSRVQLYNFRAITGKETPGLVEAEAA